MLDFKRAESKIKETINWLGEELQTIRTGRANPKLVENIQVSAYGQNMPINQLGNINVADATMITIQPWDKSVIEEILKAVKDSGISATASIDGDLIRIAFPPLSEERREEYVKLMKEKIEESRIRVRVTRKDVVLWLKDQGLSEEEKKSKEKQLQKIVDDANKELEEIKEKKEKELMTV